MQKDYSEEISNTFDPLVPQKQRAISFIESVCGLESIEESPNSGARHQDQTPNGDISDSLIVFGDIDNRDDKLKFDSRKTITETEQEEILIEQEVERTTGADEEI